MKTCSKCNQSKELTEFHCDKGKPDKLHSRCKVCNNAYVSAWQKTPIGKAKHYAIASAWQKSTENKVNHALSVKKWQKSSIGLIKLRAAWAKYNACKIQRTPPWLTKDQLNEIESYYALAKELQWLSEKPLHVDHIVPLQGDMISGLHVPWNLQILPAPLNQSKGNKFDPKNTSEKC